MHSTALLVPFQLQIQLGRLHPLPRAVVAVVAQAGLLDQARLALVVAGCLLHQTCPRALLLGLVRRLLAARGVAIPIDLQGNEVGWLRLVLQGCADFGRWMHPKVSAPFSHTGGSVAASRHHNLMV